MSFVGWNSAFADLVVQPGIDNATQWLNGCYKSTNIDGTLVFYCVDYAWENERKTNQKGDDRNIY